MSADETTFVVKGFPTAIAAIFWAAVKFVKAYPGGTAGVTTALVAVGATFGLHLSVNELTAVFSAVAVVAGVIVHLVTVPKSASPVPPAPVVAPPVPVAGPVAEPKALASPSPVIGPGAPVAVERHP